MADETPTPSVNAADLPGDHPDHPHHIRQGGAHNKIAGPRPLSREEGGRLMVRCKFICLEHTEYRSYDGKLLHKVRFNPVTTGSEENKAFYEATPGGSFEIATIREMPFTLGGEYYIDISEAR